VDLTRGCGGGQLLGRRGLSARFGWCGSRHGRDPGRGDRRWLLLERVPATVALADPTALVKAASDRVDLGRIHAHLRGDRGDLGSRLSFQDREELRLALAGGRASARPALGGGRSPPVSSAIAAESAPERNPRIIAVSMRMSRLVAEQNPGAAVVSATAVFVRGRRCGPPESIKQTPPSPPAGFWSTVMNHWLTEFRVSVAKRLAGSSTSWQ
jgi:hypothetical protein